MSSLPLIPATVIGSWSFPGWYAKFCEDVARQPELFGADDRDEAVRDAVRLAVDDQLRAGTDLITDGEMQRVDFNLGFYDYLTGVKTLPQLRHWGPPAHDQRGKHKVTNQLSAPRGLGVIEEFKRLQRLAPFADSSARPGPTAQSFEPRGRGDALHDAAGGVPGTAPPLRDFPSCRRPCHQTADGPRRRTALESCARESLQHAAKASGRSVFR